MSIFAAAPFGLSPRFASAHLVCKRYPTGSLTNGGDVVMKKLVSAIVALGLAVAFTAPTLAADVTTAKTKADCHKAGGMWDATAKACKPKA